MAAKTQRRMALRRKLHILRILTKSKSVKRSSIIMDAFIYIYNLKLQVEAIKREYHYLINHIKEVKVEKSGTGHLIVMVTCKKSEAIFVSILEAFEKLNVNVVQVRVSCKHFFGMEAIVEDTVDAAILSEAILEILRSDYQIANCKYLPVVTSSLPPFHWNPPPIGRVKLNSDASVGSDGDAGIGGALRCHSRVLVKALAQFRSNCKDIELAEGFPCLHGINIAKDNGFRDIIVESDCQNLIFAIQKGIIPRTPVGTVIGDILHLAKDFDRIDFLWIGRHQNRLAHHLAFLARTRICFDADNPSLDSICRIVSLDVSGFNE